ncbi:hypothetical protein Pelo_14169 [Pelomyxa schiedti]|nr:hypothetical protein Pelo_14169 [Pelomyxa schiedti]
MPSVVSPKGLKIELMVSNGFVRLYNQTGRAYLVAQGNTLHVTPDWKVHFSVCKEDIPRAWGILTNFVVECNLVATAMKAVTFLDSSIDGDRWPETMHGREITVYIYKYHSSYGKGIEYTEDGKNLLIPLRKCDECPPRFWLDFISKADKMLANENIHTNGGCAKGDLPMGKYASLRNEAFVLWPKEVIHADPKTSSKEPELEYCYPPNESGWNGANHEPPFPLTRLGKLYASPLTRVAIFMCCACLALAIFLAVSPHNTNP